MSSPTRRPNTSRSVSTPSSRSSWAVTNTESPVPVRWIARRHSAREVPGGTVTGSRRARTPSFSSMMEGTRAVTARSVRSATRKVYVGGPERTPTATAPARRGCKPTSAGVVGRRVQQRHRGRMNDRRHERADDGAAGGRARHEHRSGTGANEPKHHERKEQREDWFHRQGGDQSRPGDHKGNGDGPPRRG